MGALDREKELPSSPTKTWVCASRVWPGHTDLGTRLTQEALIQEPALKCRLKAKRRGPVLWGQNQSIVLQFLPFQEKIFFLIHIIAFAKKIHYSWAMRFTPWLPVSLSRSFFPDWSIEPVWVNRSSGWLQNCYAQPFQQAQIVTIEVNGTFCDILQVTIIMG